MTTIGLFTACFDGYHRWLPEWEHAVAQMDPQPAEVGIVGDEDAQQAWSGRGLFVLAPEFGSPFRQAAAYNHLLERMTAEWVAHVGADDLPKPGLIGDVAPHTVRFDVVAFDNQSTRNGLPVQTRRNRPTAEKVLTPTMAKAPLDACAFFRRTFWEQHPYDPEHEGGSDVALWIRFAGAGARFGWTGKVGIEYRLHDDSLWHSRHPDRRRQVKRRLNELRGQVQ